MTLDQARKSRRLRRLVGRVWSRVRSERAFGTTIPEWLKQQSPEWTPPPLWTDGDFADLIAQMAGCDWLYNRETGEVRFFEYA